MKPTHKILVVDDEPMGQQLLEAIFYSEEYSLYFANNGHQALEIAKEIQPDIILMDVMMPEMDGFEVCRKIREEEKTNSIPILLITALDDRDSRMKGLEAGANDYISKPFDRIEILSKVRNIFRIDNRNNGTKSEGTMDSGSRDEAKIPAYLRILSASMESRSVNPDGLFDGFFKIFRRTGSVPGKYWLILNRNEKLYCLFISHPGSKLTDVLFSLSFFLLFENMVLSGNISKASELLRVIFDKLNADLNSDKASGSPENLSLSIALVDKAGHCIWEAGMNCVLVVADKEEITHHLHLGKNNVLTNDESDEQVIPLKGPVSLYIFTPELPEALSGQSEESASSASKIEDFFRNLQQLNFSKQEQQLALLIDKAFNKSDITDAAIIGIKL